MNRLTQLYPLTAPFRSGFLPTLQGHRVWYTQAGNPKGIPLIMIHGGPGHYSQAKTRTLFNPAKFHLIQFDQRGAGQSRPLGRLEQNTTADLLIDLARLQDELKLASAYLYGSSWGTTLALLAAEANPERVRGLILKGVFLASSEDLYQTDVEATRRYFPELYAPLLAYLKKYALEVGPTFYAHLLKQLQSEEPAAVQEAFRLLEGWGLNLMTVAGRVSSVAELPPEPEQIQSWRIYSHYFAQGAFLEENQILAAAKRLARVPTWIIHGRLDLLCPASRAYALHERLPLSRLEIITGSGHSNSAWLDEAVQRVADGLS